MGQLDFVKIKYSSTLYVVNYHSCVNITYLSSEEVHIHILTKFLLLKCNFIIRSDFGAKCCLKYFVELNAT